MRWEATEPEPLGLVDTDRRIARYVWLERRRFEMLGAWAVSVPELEVKALFAVQAHHHAWHASLWERHLPRRSGPITDHMDEAAADLSDWARALEEPSGEGATLSRLVGAYRVTAAQAVAAYSDHLARASSLTDAAVGRTCRLVLADQIEDWRDGERVLQSQMRSGEEVERAAAHQARLEKLLLAAGGIAGPGTVTAG